jgi:hypothetical protein
MLLAVFNEKQIVAIIFPGGSLKNTKIEILPI